MPLLGDESPGNPILNHVPYPVQPGQGFSGPGPTQALPVRKQSQHSFIAKTAILNHFYPSPSDDSLEHESHETMGQNSSPPKASENTPKPPQTVPKYGGSLGAALTDTPTTTAPNSPKM